MMSAPRPSRGLLARRLTAGIVAITLVALGTACSLRSDDAPRPIAKEAIPTILYQQNPASTTTVISDSTTQQRTLYIVRSKDATENLVGQSAAIASPTDPRDLPRTVLDRLVSNPPVSEQADLVSFIPPTVKILSAVQDGDVLDIDLSNLKAIEGTHLRLAVAQLVFTATELPGINGVRFKVDGTPSAVNLDEKSSDPTAIIRRADFPTLSSTATGGSTTTTEAPVETTAVAPAALTEPTAAATPAGP
jgi:hypothetical protein